MTEDYVSFETAKLLKEKGFDEPCLMCYNSDKKLEGYGHYNSYRNSEVFALTAPTLQMTIKWLREVHKLYVVVRPYVTEDGIFSLFDVKSIKGKDIVANIKTRTGFNSYEEACEAAIKYCLENLI